MSKPIQQTVAFAASPHDVYEALMDSDKHAAFTHAAASINRQVGGEFNAYDGYISGKNLELIPDQTIKQSWRAIDWEAGKYSTVTFELTATPDGTRLDFSHTNVPAGTEAEFTQGWIENYWEPMKAYFEETRKKDIK